MLDGVHPCLKILKGIRLGARNLLGQDGLSHINLSNHIMHHDACDTSFESTSLAVSIGSLNCIGSIVSACDEFV